MDGSQGSLGVAVEGGDPSTNPVLHNTRMVLDEASLARGVALHHAMAERFLTCGFDG